MVVVMSPPEKGAINVIVVCRTDQHHNRLSRTAKDFLLRQARGGAPSM
jgi:hypothetical protein